MKKWVRQFNERGTCFQETEWAAFVFNDGLVEKMNEEILENRRFTFGNAF